MMQNMTEWIKQTNLTKISKSKNPDVDDYGPDKVRDGNVKSKDAEKVRKDRDVYAKLKQSVVLVQPIEMLQDRVMHIQGIKKGGKLSRTDYLKDFKTSNVKTLKQMQNGKHI